MYSATKRLLNMRKSLGELESYEFTFDGIIITSPNGITNISWDNVTKILELNLVFSFIYREFIAISFLKDALRIRKSSIIL